jgi:hypothetical protein
MTKTEIGPGRLNPDGPNSHRIQYPNTDSYKNGLITQTGVRISDIKQEDDYVMSFRVEFDFADDFISTDDKPLIIPADRSTAKPTDRPTNRPTDRPTGRPTTTPTNNRVKNSTNKPTYAPSARPIYKPSARPTARLTATQTRSPVSSYTTGAMSNSNDLPYKEIVGKFAASNDRSNEAPNKDDYEFTIEREEKEDITLLVTIANLQEDFDILTEIKEPASFAKTQCNPTISKLVVIACSILSIYCNIL